MNDPIIDHNLKMIQELLPEYQQQVTDFMYEAFKRNKKCKISEVYRSEDKNILMFCSGKTLEQISMFDMPKLLLEKMKNLLLQNTTLYKGIYKTNHPVSPHQFRKAFDLKPLDCSYSDLHDIAIHYGIDWTIPNERWHFEVVSKPQSPEMLKIDMKNDKPKKRFFFF